MAEQNFANHTRLVPPFHFFVLPVLAINLVGQIYSWVRMGFAPSRILPILVAAALLLGFLSVRLMVLRVQDRLIRLEERLRYERLLPADLQPRIGEFTVSQLVSLRFASNAELPALARKVLAEKLASRKAIKQLIKEWRPDYLRA